MFNGSLCEPVKYPGKIPRGNAPPTLGCVSVETIKATREILIFAGIIIGEFHSLSTMDDLSPSLVLGCNFLFPTPYLMHL